MANTIKYFWTVTRDGEIVERCTAYTAEGAIEKVRMPRIPSFRDTGKWEAIKGGIAHTGTPEIK